MVYRVQIQHADGSIEPEVDVLTRLQLIKRWSWLEQVMPKDERDFFKMEWVVDLTHVSITEIY